MLKNPLLILTLLSAVSFSLTGKSLLNAKASTSETENHRLSISGVSDQIIVKIDQVLNFDYKSITTQDRFQKDFKIMHSNLTKLRSNFMDNKFDCKQISRIISQSKKILAQTKKPTSGTYYQINNVSITHNLLLDVKSKQKSCG